MGHRGARAIAPENSIEGFTWAIDNGLRGVELDVRLTADGVLVCAHDESLERLGGSTAPIAAMDANQVADVVLAGGVRVPSLAEVLDLAAGRLALNVELKSDAREASFDSTRACATVLADLLDARDAASSGDRIVAVSSFDAEAVRRFAAASTRHGSTAALLTPPGHNARRIISEAAVIGVSAVHPHYSSLLTQGACTNLREEGLTVRTWTVNNRRVARRLRRYGVEIIVTDDPRRLI